MKSRKFQNFLIPMSAHANLVYCQHMVHFCETQANEWLSIREKLTGLLENTAQEGSLPSKPQRPAPKPAANIRQQNPPARAARVEQRPQQEPGPNDAQGAQLRMRLAHVIRGIILIFALGLPKMFYYLYGVYGVFVLSGALDKLQSTEFRQYLTGARPSLDVQLARLRQRSEMLQKLAEIEKAIEQDEEFDAEEFRRVNEFLSSLEPAPGYSWVKRFGYQLFFLFIYSALPACHPHPEYIK